MVASSVEREGVSSMGLPLWAVAEGEEQTVRRGVVEATESWLPRLLVFLRLAGRVIR